MEVWLWLLVIVAIAVELIVLICWLLEFHVCFFDDGRYIRIDHFAFFCVRCVRELISLEGTEKIKRNISDILMTFSILFTMLAIASASFYGEIKLIFLKWSFYLFAIAVSVPYDYSQILLPKLDPVLLLLLGHPIVSMLLLHVSMTVDMFFIEVVLSSLIGLIMAHLRLRLIRDVFAPFPAPAV